MAKVKSGFAFHLHHNKLIEFCADYQERVDFIRNHKPAGEVNLRLSLFKLIPARRLPSKLREAWKAYNRAEKAYNKAWDAFDKAGKAYKGAGKAYHEAWNAHNKAWEAYHEAWDAYDEARRADAPHFAQLHEELCPNCPWDGKTILRGLK